MAKRAGVTKRAATGPKALDEGIKLFVSPAGSLVALDQDCTSAVENITLDQDCTSAVENVVLDQDCTSAVENRE